MRAQIRGLSRASRNTMDGISLIQTAEGALQEVHGILQRINELAVQSASDTNMQMDRESLQAEVSQLISEVDDISGTTRFNDAILLDGRFGKRTNTTAPNIFVFDAAARRAVTTIQQPMYYDATSRAEWDKLKVILEKEIVPQAVTKILNTFSDTFGYLRDSSIGIGLKLYESNSSTLAAIALQTAWDNSVSPAGVDMIYSLEVNMSYVLMDSNNDIYEGNRMELENTIAHEMMHAMMMEALTSGMVGMDQDMNYIGGFPEWFAEGTAQAAAGAANAAPNWLGISAASSEDEIKNALRANSIGVISNASSYGTGYLASMYLGWLAGGQAMTTDSIARGLDVIMNDIRGGGSLSDAIANNTHFTSLSDFENRFADEGASFVKQLLTASAGGRGGLITDDLTAGDVLANVPIDNQPLFKLNTEYNAVKNEYPDGYTVVSGGSKDVTGAAGPDHVNSNTGGTGGGTGGTGGGGAGGGTGGGGTGGTGGGGTGGAGGIGGIIIQSGAESGNITTIFIDSMSSAGLGISAVNISTRQGATTAISTARNAINKVSLQRAEIGSMQNRLEYKMANLDNTAENLSAAESLIRDADMAAEMSRFTKYQVLQQAGYAILAQANSINNNVLSLLKM